MVDPERVGALSRALAAVRHAERRWWEALDAAQAGRLASGLVAGAACPVCGGVEHPQPAHDSPLLDADVEMAASVHAEAVAVYEALAASTVPPGVTRH